MNQPSDYPTPVVATWNLSFDRLKERSPAAVRLLQLLAFFSPGPISMDLLYCDELNAALLPFDETLSEQLMLPRVIRDISRFALVKVDQGSNSLQIHRLVQAVIRSQMTDEERREVQHEVHKILAAARPRQGETDDPSNWSTYEIIWPHLGPSQAEECDDPRTRQLLIDWVRYQWKHGEFEACLSLAQRLQNLWTHQLGPDHPQTLHLQFQIANVLRSQGRFNEARDLDTYVLERQQAVLGADHLLTLMTAGGLGADLRALGEFQPALEARPANVRELQGRVRRGLSAGRWWPPTTWPARCAWSATTPRRAVSTRRHLTAAGWCSPPITPTPSTRPSNLANDMRAAGAFRESVELLRDTWEKIPGGARRRHDRHAARRHQPGRLAAQGRRAGRGHEPGAGHLRTLRAPVRQRLTGGAIARHQSGLRLRGGG